MSCVSLSSATDTISRGDVISGNHTIVSKGGTFELGFFTPGNSRNYYIGIWYKNIQPQTVVWVANRETPVSDPSTSRLKLTDGRTLVLISQSSTLPVWSSKSDSTAQPSESIDAVLLDTGNLIVRSWSSIIWQSFDHLTDTWLPPACFGMNRVTGEYQTTTPWRNSEDPAPGPFVVTIDPSGLNQFIYIWNNSKTYYSSGVWNGRYFSYLPEMVRGGLYNCKFIDDDSRRCFTESLIRPRGFGRVVIRSSGQVQHWLWFDISQGWTLIWSNPFSLCDIYSTCGAYGLCDNAGKPECSCPNGFSPVSARDWELGGWSAGCARNTQLDCRDKNATSDKFLIMSNVKLPSDPSSVDAVLSAEECRAACLKDCTCTAYAYESGCSIWNGDIRNLQKLSVGSNNASMLYLRLAASDMPNSSSEKNSTLEITIIIAAVVIILAIALVSMWVFHRRRAIKSSAGPLISFSYGDLQRATKNFSVKLGGGGFGSVFKGVLQDSTQVAVKRLEGIRQGEKQFRNEITTLGMIQHVNLVRLRGFSCKGTKRLLVYDYMENGSLDQHLRQEDSSCKTLDWKSRYNIILGTARGLAYLHEECRECIIHCDIKPENILLDSENHPKLSDFGMAKLLGHDFSRVLTTMRGTIGYLAPEWIEGLPITAKADVYSFGMMIIEVVSGRRNSKLSKDRGFWFFPVHAAKQVIKGEVMSLLDEKLEGRADSVEVSRVCRVACWCIQACESERPSMGEVVNMLEGCVEVEVPPFPETLLHLAGEDLV